MLGDTLIFKTKPPSWNTPSRFPLQEVFLGSASGEESYLTSNYIPNYGAGYKGPHSTWENSEQLSQVQSAL